MMDTVPDEVPLRLWGDYLRLFSTFIPRHLAEQAALRPQAWVDAWIAGSELEREEDFTGPAIGILGATQLNGGAIGDLDRHGRARAPAPHRL